MIPPAEIWKRFYNLGVQGLSEQNGLTPEENEHLFDAVTANEVVLLVAHGLARKKGRSD